MRHHITLTQTKAGGVPIHVNPDHIKAIEQDGDLATIVYCGGEDFWRVIETPEEIDMRIDVLKLKQEK